MKLKKIHTKKVHMLLTSKSTDQIIIETIRLSLKTIKVSKTIDFVKKNRNYTNYLPMIDSVER